MSTRTPPDSFQLDKAGMRASFDRASRGYEAAAVLQARVADELLDRLEPFDFEPGVILDLGSGTGRAAALLKRRYRRALVIAMDLAPGMLRQAARHQRLLRRFERVCADAARIPLKTASVDIVFSNLMLQWCDPLDHTLGEVRRVLKPRGFLAFSTFGPDTLSELRSAWARVDTHNHVNRFLDMHDVGGALMRAGLQEPVLDVDRIRLTYDDALAVMRDLKSIGASNVTAGRPRSLLGRAHLQRVAAAYEAFRQNGRLPATYEVIYGAAWGSAGRPEASTHGGGEVSIPLASIRQRK